MRVMMRLSLLFFVFMVNIAWAQEESSQVPNSCTDGGFAFQNKLLVFNTDNKTTARIFILHNNTQGTVMLAHDKIDPGASAGWSSKLDKDKWSMVVITQPGFSLGCMLYSPPSIGPVDCGSVLTVCAIPSDVSLGSGWIAENSSLSKILAMANSRGIKM